MKKEILDQMFNLVDKRSTGDGDVMIRIIKAGLLSSGERCYQLAMRFSKDATKKVAPNTGYLKYVYIPDENRLYYREAPRGCGYKLSGTGRPCIAPTVKDASAWEKYRGIYNLLYDSEAECYYVDLNKKLL